MISSTFASRKLREMVKVITIPKVPKHISSRFLKVDKQDSDIIEASLKQYFFLSDEEYLSTADGKKDLRDHMVDRLTEFRNTVIPWLSSAKSLTGANILEIGCGTGSSTVALAEQGAKVIAVDIHEESLIVAKERCKAYRLEAGFFNTNATEVHKIFSNYDFDFIIFFASLEHMTHDERIIAMKYTWDMLGAGKLWCVIETPNRLWFYDAHTSHLPFYNWLPNDLAFMYSQFSPKRSFCAKYREKNKETKMDFLRRGRGVSYHEFELSMDKAENFDVVSSLPIFLRKKNLLRKLLWKLTIESRFESLLAKFNRQIHRGFYQPSLDLIIRKGMVHSSQFLH